MEIKLVVLEFIEHLAHQENDFPCYCFRRKRLELTDLTAMYLLSAMFNFPFRLCASASSKRKSRDCISCRSAAGLGASFFYRKSLIRPSVRQKKPTPTFVNKPKFLIASTTMPALRRYFPYLVFKKRSCPSRTLASFIALAAPK